jgi:hypothetical protein
MERCRDSERDAAAARKDGVLFSRWVARASSITLPLSTTWSGELSFARSTSMPSLSASSARRRSTSRSRLEDRGHRAFAERHRFLHELAALAHEHRGARDVEHAGGGEGRVLAETVSAEETCVEAVVRAQRSEDGQLGGEERRLLELGAREALGVFEADPCDVVRERLDASSNTRRASG